jgi:hypothetical protein
MPLPDRTKSGFRDVSYPGNPNIDTRWGDVLLDSGAIQCADPQFAGPKAVWMEQDEATVGRIHQGHDPRPPKLPRTKKYQ